MVYKQVHNGDKPMYTNFRRGGLLLSLLAHTRATHAERKFHFSIESRLTPPFVSCISPFTPEQNDFVCHAVFVVTSSLHAVKCLVVLCTGITNDTFYIMPSSENTRSCQAVCILLTAKYVVLSSLFSNHW